MLQAYPTKRGTGVEIYGTIENLKSLHDTTHQIAETLDENDPGQKSQRQLLVYFAYKIRYGYSGGRLVKNIALEGEETKQQYFGFQFVWTDILVIIAVLHHNAGRFPVNSTHWTNLCMIVDVIENALYSYDEKGAPYIQDFVGQRIDITNPLFFIISQALQIKFVKMPGGKSRFRKIPKLLITHFSDCQKEYQELLQHLEISARANNCEIKELDFEEYPEIKW